MMASITSVRPSDSAKDVFAIGHQGKQKEETGHRVVNNSSMDGNVDSSNEMPMYVQCLLVMVFAGMELSLTFTLIYSILFLQFVGLPTSLLSLGGVLCGSFTMVLLPVVGVLADRGSDPLISKMKLMFICLFAYTIGYTGLIICSASKLHPEIINQENITQIIDLSNNIPYTDNFTVGNTKAPPVLLSTHRSILDYYLHPHGSEFNSTNYMSGPNHETKSDVISYLSLVSFGMIDIGFDSGMGLCRVFILECSSINLHTRLLVLATVFSSIGGVTFSLISVINFPQLLAPMFGVDGTAATVLMFSTCILIFVICCFACTMITAYLQSRKCRKTKDRFDSHIASNDIKIPNLSTETSTDPLLSKNWAGDRSYSSLSLTIASRTICDSKEKFMDSEDLDPESENEDDDHDRGSHQMVIKYQNQDKRITTNKENVPYHNLISDNEEIDDADKDEEKINDYNENQGDGMSTTIAAIQASYSMSLSMIQSSLFGVKASGDVQNVDAQMEGDRKQSILKNKRLQVLCVSVSFTCGSMYLFSIYHSDVLTVGIYKGDPTALPGSKGKQLYDEGISKASLGSLILYLTYVAVSLLNKKIIQVIGEKAEFIICQTIYISVLLAFLLVQTEDLYYASTAAAGVFRACTFTLGYVLANKIVRDKHAGIEENSKSVAKDIGHVTLLIGFLLPNQYFLISTMVGPLLSATGNVWVPIIMATVWSVTSVVVFSPLSVT